LQYIFKQFRVSFDPDLRWIFVALTVTCHWHIDQEDVKTSFPNSDKAGLHESPIKCTFTSWDCLLLIKAFHGLK
jgi:hypothetical protein